MATVIDSYSQTNQSATLDIYGFAGSGGQGNLAQSFTGDGKVLDYVQFYLKKSGSPTGNMTARIRTHTGTFGSSSGYGSSLALSGTVSAASLTTSYQLITFTFTGVNLITLANGTKYSLCFEFNGGNSSNVVQAGYDNTSSSHAGNMYWEDDFSQYYTDDLCFYVYGNVSGDPVIDSYSETNQSQDIPLLELAGVYALAQSFTGNGSTLTVADLYMKKTGAPSGNLTAKIFAHSGTFGSSSVPTGAALATSGIINATSLSTSYGLITFTFSGGNQISLGNGTNYCLVLAGSFTSGSDYPIWGADNTSPTHGGNAATLDGSAVWNVLSTTDLCFYVRGVAGASFIAAAGKRPLQAVRRASFY